MKSGTVLRAKTQPKILRYQLRENQRSASGIEERGFLLTRSHVLRGACRTASPIRSRNCIAFNAQSLWALDPDLKRVLREYRGGKVNRVGGDRIALAGFKGLPSAVQSPFDPISHAHPNRWLRKSFLIGADISAQHAPWRR